MRPSVLKRKKKYLLSFITHEACSSRYGFLQTVNCSIAKYTEPQFPVYRKGKWCHYARFNFFTGVCFRETTIRLTYLLTPWSKGLLEKLTVLQLVKKFPAFYGTRRFITALTSARHLSISWASSIQSTHPHPTSGRSILILSTTIPLTYLRTPWSRVLLEKLTGLQLVKKFPEFYVTRGFITALTSTRHLSLS